LWGGGANRQYRHAFNGSQGTSGLRALGFTETKSPNSRVENLLAKERSRKGAVYISEIAVRER